VRKIKGFFGFIFAKETLIKIILIQFILLLFGVMSRGEIRVYHTGFIDIGNHGSRGFSFYATHDGSIDGNIDIDGSVDGSIKVGNTGSNWGDLPFKVDVTQ
jgi:hypothetical protein